MPVACCLLKIRGSAHDKEIREFTIDGGGLHIGKTFRTVSGILSGQLTHTTPSEIERLGNLFKDDSGD